MDKLVVGVTDFKYEVRFDLRGCLEAIMSLEAKRVLRSNMHLTRYLGSLNSYPELFKDPCADQKILFQILFQGA